MLRWRRSDLDSLLSRSEQLGQLHATKHHRVTYVEVRDNVPETERYMTGHEGLLIAPLHDPDSELLGVLTTEGPVEIAHPAPGTCELVELYAEQARLAAERACVVRACWQNGCGCRTPPRRSCRRRPPPRT